MPDLHFHVQAAAPLENAMSAAIKLEVVVTNQQPEHRVQSALLAVQVRADARARSYDANEGEKLRDLFGDPGRHARTLSSLLWTTAQLIVPSFPSDVTVELHLPLTLDLTAAIARYLYALEHGVVPLQLYFSGTVFTMKEGGGITTSPVPWSREARFALDVAVIKKTIELYYPSQRFLALDQTTFDRLLDYKSRASLPTLEQAVAALLDGSDR